ncbi:MAG TPA: hypothetical protein VH120_20055 [Gemmataceae bacterium]|nr:hypothetical protein [Gemmataceae bacterium]
MPEPAAIEDAVQRALAELGETASGPVVAAHVERAYGVSIDPRFLPVYRASILGRQRLEQDQARRRSTTGITAPNSSGNWSPISAAIDSAGQTTSDRLAAFEAALTLPDLSRRLDRVRDLARGL